MACITALSRLCVNNALRFFGGPSICHSRACEIAAWPPHVHQLCHIRTNHYRFLLHVLLDLVLALYGAAAVQLGYEVGVLIWDY